MVGSQLSRKRRLSVSGRLRPIASGSERLSEKVWLLVGGISISPPGSDQRLSRRVCGRPESGDPRRGVVGAIRPAKACCGAGEENGASGRLAAVLEPCGG